VQALLAVAGLLFVLAVMAAPRSRRARRHAAVSAATAVALLLSGCGVTTSSSRHALSTTRQVLYYHQAIGAGPSFITRADGTVFEERRFEPFGEEIDAYRELPGGGSEIGPVDYRRDDQNHLNKQTDPATGWSYHGARWMAPETARWLTPDPPVKGPDSRFLTDPWGLHPYQYVEQNPVLFWDPDGRERGLLPSSAANDICVARGTCSYEEWEHYHDLVSGRTPKPVPPDKVSTQAERAAGFHANAKLASYVPTPGVVLGLAIDFIAIATEPDRDAPVDLSSVDPTTLAPPVGPPGGRWPSLTRRASQKWPKHHPFPKYLGGAPAQTLKKIPRKLHEQFHTALDRWMGGKYSRRKGAEHFKNMDRETVIKDVRQFYSEAEGGLFKKYLPDFEQAVRESR
jgi:RHS repeat-associated protein